MTSNPLKSIAPFLGVVLLAVLQALQAAYSDGIVSLVEALNLGIVLGAAVVTYVIPNVDGSIAKWLKPLVTAATAGVLVLVNALQDTGVTEQTWVMVAIQVIGAVVVVAPVNKYAPKHAPDEPIAA